jgi:hypothetical protein
LPKKELAYASDIHLSTENALFFLSLRKENIEKAVTDLSSEHQINGSVCVWVMDIYIINWINREQEHHIDSE